MKICLVGLIDFVGNIWCHMSKHIPFQSKSHAPGSTIIKVYSLVSGWNTVGYNLGSLRVYAKSINIKRKLNVKGHT